MPVAVEMQDDVDQVLQRPRPGYRAVLGHVPDEHGGQHLLLRHLHQGGGHLADLGNPAGRAVNAGDVDGLYRVDDQQAGGQVGLRGKIKLIAHGPDPVSAELYLRG